MIFKVIRTMAVVAAGALAPVVSAPAKSVSTDAEVQMLANFPALQRLAAKSDGKALRRYLSHVSASYRSAGYGSIADVSLRLDALIEIFTDGGESTAKDHRRARAVLRSLAAALSADQEVALPADSGQRVPNYYGLAATFYANASRALKNLEKGKNVSNFLRQKTETSWVLNLGDGEFAVTKGDLATRFSVDFSKAGTGTLVLGGGNSYSGSRLNSGTLATSVGNGSLVVSGSGFGAGTVSINAGSALVLGNTAGYRWVGFPPAVPIPDDWASFSKSTLSAETTIGTEIFPSGTRIVRAPADAILPAGAVELPAGATLQPTLSLVAGGGNLSSGTFGTSGTLTPVTDSGILGFYFPGYVIGSGTLTWSPTGSVLINGSGILTYATPTPTPSPTPAE